MLYNENLVKIAATFIIIGITGIVFSAIAMIGGQTARNPIADKPVDKWIEFAEGATSPEQTDPGVPIRLEIPRLEVSAIVESVGLTPEGVMDVPKDPVDVVWFNQGPRPGENGNAVIAGHFGWKNGIPAAFDGLHNLVKGDKIYVEDEKGTMITFVVRELRVYGENDNASDVFTSIDGKPHLNLVTCKGVWNKAEKSYSERLVVFTDKE